MAIVLRISGTSPHISPMSTKRPCVVCGLEFKPRRSDAKTCCDTCRKRLQRGQHLAYLREWPPARQRAREAIHLALADAIAVESVVRAPRRQRRKITSRTV